MSSPLGKQSDSYLCMKQQQILSSMLHDACLHIAKTNNAAKHIDSLKMLLYMKRDVAKTKLEELMQELYQRVASLQHSIESEIDMCTLKKERMMKAEKSKLTSHIQDVAAECSTAEELLRDGNNNEVLEHSPKVVHALGVLLSESTEANIADANYLELMFNTNRCDEHFRKIKRCLYVRSGILDPLAIKVEKCGMKLKDCSNIQAVCGVEEILNIRALEIDTCPNIWTGYSSEIKVEIIGSLGNIIEHKLEENLDGTLLLSFVPTTPGITVIKVELYDCAILNSPFNLVTVEPTVPDIDARLTKSRVCIDRTALGSVQKHIKSNPITRPSQMYADVERRISASRGRGKSITKIHRNQHVVDQNYNTKMFDRNAEQTRDQWEHRHRNSRLSHYEHNDFEKDHKHSTLLVNTETEKSSAASTSIPHMYVGEYANKLSNKYTEDLASDLANRDVVNERQVLENDQEKDLVIGISNRLEKEKEAEQRDVSSAVIRDKLFTIESKTDRDKTNFSPQNVKDTSKRYMNIIEASCSEISDGETDVPDKLTETVPSHENAARSQHSNWAGSWCITDQYNMISEPHISRYSDKLTTLSNKQLEKTLHSNVTQDKSENNSVAQSHDNRSDEHLNDKLINEKERDYPPQTSCVQRASDSNCWDEEICPVRGIITGISEFSKTEDLSSVPEKKPAASDYAHDVSKLESHDDSPAKEKIATIFMKDWLGDYLELNAGKVILAKFVMKIGFRGQGEKEQLNFPIGVTVNSATRDIIICDSSNGFTKVFCGSTGKHKFNLAARFNRPSAVVANKEGNIFVKDNICIQAFAQQGSHIRTFGKSLIRPFGLDIDSDDNLVVLDHGTRPTSICFFTQKGDRCKTISLEDTVDYSSKCRFLCTVNNSVAITDLGCNRVLVRNQDGKIKLCFGTTGSKIGEMREPAGITHDGHGRLIIADSKNHRIQVFDMDGTYRAAVQLSTGIFRPSDIYLAPNGQLFISNFLEHSVKVYQFDIQ